jgi:hypothetical protein
MTSSGKTIGMIMIVAGIAIALVAAMFFGSGAASGRTAAAMILGFGLVFVVVVLPLVGVGGFLFVKGRQEAAAFAQVEKEERVLNMSGSMTWWARDSSRATSTGTRGSSTPGRLQSWAPTNAPTAEGSWSWQARAW